MTSLVDEFYNIVDGYYNKSDSYERVEKALIEYERIKNIVQIDSLASDGMEMIKAALRDQNSGMDT